MQRNRRSPYYVLLVPAALWIPNAAAANRSVERFGLFETSIQATGDYANPYTDLDAEATLKRPDGSTRSIPLFWGDGDTWKLRVSPDITGEWSFTVRSRDKGLNGKSDSFTCTRSGRRGSIRPMRKFPHHFQYQNGDRLWFMGDTAWALFTDSHEEKHNRQRAEAYLRTRAAQGFNVVHAMVLSEAGWGNSGGPPFHDMGSQAINPAYWQEMDRRLGYANDQGIVVGLAIAWGDKRKVEPFAWRRFPNLDARKRYARYVAARYSAYAVYFLVSGEWHAEVRTRPSTETEIKREFVDIGDVLAAADPHERMIGIHPMTRQGSVREFNDAAWMSFGDYQQNYRDLHARMLQSRHLDKPVVNAEYGYHLRDRDGDGTPDKDNSTSLEPIRHASWDIVMTGGYLVTGFGTTYFGGHRDPGPFDVGAEQNDAWEEQIAVMQRFFAGLEWWRFTPHDERLSGPTPRGQDRRELGRTAPPKTTYWCLADPGRHYVVYMRGLERPVSVQIDGPDADWRVRQFNPRSGTYRTLTDRIVGGRLRYTPPNERDWVVHIRRRQ